MRTGYTGMLTQLLSDATDGKIGEVGCVGRFCEELKESENPGTTLESFFSVLLLFFTTLGGLMFIIYFVLGCFTWLTSEGEKEKLQRATSQMTNALLGLVILVASYSLIFIVGRILGLDILSPAQQIAKMIPEG